VCFKECYVADGTQLVFFFSFSLGLALRPVQKDLFHTSLYTAFVTVGLLPQTNVLCLFYSIILISVTTMDCQDMIN
jgi:hypothetical protein